MNPMCWRAVHLLREGPGRGRSRRGRQAKERTGHRVSFPFLSTSGTDEQQRPAFPNRPLGPEGSAQPWARRCCRCQYSRLGARARIRASHGYNRFHSATWHSCPAHKDEKEPCEADAASEDVSTIPQVRDSFDRQLRARVSSLYAYQIKIL